MDNQHSTWTLHAPNIHTGGGLALLQTLLSTLPSDVRFLQCDVRAKDRLNLPPDVCVTYVAPTMLSRLCAEWRLRSQGNVLCLSSLPPLFTGKARAVVLVHSRLLVSDDPLGSYPLRVRLRLMVERYWLRHLRSHADMFVVQTPSMARELKRTLGDVPIKVCLFAPEISMTPSMTPRHDFVYPATGDAHKNHATLLDGWRQLARLGFNPSLALTVDAARYPQLGKTIEAAVREGLNITNLGMLPASEMSALYQSSRALVFPSRTESLGLPLLEAQHYGLPILAPELDYVRDVVTPAETFDANSALSIARAVLRHLAQPMPVAGLEDAETFWSILQHARS